MRETWKKEESLGRGVRQHCSSVSVHERVFWRAEKNIEVVIYEYISALEYLR